MKYSSVFRLSLLALLLTGCGEDDAGTTAWTRPGRTGSGREIPSFAAFRSTTATSRPEAETRTAYGPLTNGSWPIYWRSGDRVEVISPQTTPQRATVEVRVSGATESEADLSDTGMVWGEGLHDFYAFYPSGAIRANAGSIVVAAVPAVQTCNNGEVQHAVCLHGRPAPRMWPKARWFRLHSVR